MLSRSTRWTFKCYMGAVSSPEHKKVHYRPNQTTFLLKHAVTAFLSLVMKSLQKSAICINKQITSVTFVLQKGHFAQIYFSERKEGCKYRNSRCSRDGTSPRRIVQPGRSASWA